jgi:hypothetical protein
VRKNLATGATEHVQRAMPYLADELAQHPPVGTVLDGVKVTQAAIGNIENKIGGYVQQYPTDTIRNQPLTSIIQELQKNPRGTALDKGLKELSDLSLDPDTRAGG